MTEVQYTFKFHSSRITQEEVDLIFKSEVIDLVQFQTHLQKFGANVYACKNLLKVLRGVFEKSKVDRVLNKATISFKITFAKGTSNKYTNKCLVDYPRDASVITWPPSVVPKRKNLSINQVRQIIKTSKSGCNSLETGLVGTFSNENLDELILRNDFLSIQRVIGKPGIS